MLFQMTGHCVSLSSLRFTSNLNSKGMESDIRKDSRGLSRNILLMGEIRRENQWRLVVDPPLFAGFI